MAWSGRFCRLKSNFLLHWGLHLRLRGSRRDYGIFSENSLGTIEVSNLLNLLRERLFLLEFFRFLHLLCRQRLGIVIIVRHVLHLLVKISSFANLTYFGGSCVEVFRLCDHSTICVSVILFDFHSVSLMLIRSLIDLFLDHFSWLEHYIMASCFVSIVNFFSLQIASLRVVRVADRYVARFRYETWIQMTLFNLFGCKIARL